MLQTANDQYKDKCYILEGELANKIEECNMLRGDN